MNTLPSGQHLPAEKNVPQRNRRAILLEIAELYGELNIAKFNVTLLENRLAEKQSELKQFDHME